MEDNPNKLCIKGTCVAIAIFLTAICGLGYILHRSLQAEQQRTEQRRLKHEAELAEREAYATQESLSRSENVGKVAENKFMRELESQFGVAYELTARNYYELYQARTNARVSYHYTNRDAIRADELKRYNVNRAIIGLPPTTEEELGGK